MSAAVAPLRPELAASLKVAADPDAPRDRALDLTTIHLIEKRLRAARLEVQQAWLYAKGCKHAEDLIRAANSPLRATHEVFGAAFVRGKL